MRLKPEARRGNIGDGRRKKEDGRRETEEGRRETGDGRRLLSPMNSSGTDSRLPNSKLVSSRLSLKQAFWLNS